METGKSDIKNIPELIKPLLYEFCGTALVVYSYNFASGNYTLRAFAYFIGYMIAC